MPFLDHLRSRLILVSRAIMWIVVAMVIGVGLLHNTPAWAVTDATCPDHSHLSIPTAPKTIYLIYNGSVSYSVSLCKPASAEVDVTVIIPKKNLVVVSPIKLTFDAGSTGPKD